MEKRRGRAGGGGIPTLKGASDDCRVIAVASAWATGATLLICCFGNSPFWGRGGPLCCWDNAGFGGRALTYLYKDGGLFFRARSKLHPLRFKERVFETLKRGYLEPKPQHQYCGLSNFAGLPPPPGPAQRNLAPEEGPMNVLCWI